MAAAAAADGWKAAAAGFSGCRSSSWSQAASFSTYGFHRSVACIDSGSGFGAPSERRRLHAAPAGSAALLLVDCLIVALSSSAAQGSCTRSPGPSAACFLPGCSQPPHLRAEGVNLRVRELLGAPGCPWPHPAERHATGCRGVRHSSEDQFRTLLHSLLLMPRHDIRQAAVVAEVLRILLPLLWAPASPHHWAAAGGGDDGGSPGCEGRRAPSRQQPVL